MVLYLVPAFLIFRNRKSHAVSVKSPTLIIVAIIFLMLESIINAFIWKTNYFAEDFVFNCALGTYCTLFVHYTSYAAIVFRALRVFKLLRIEREYLNDLYQI